jgi:hypothetical protein
MKHHIIRLTGVFLVLVLAVVATAGTWSANNFFYHPSLGARGPIEKNNFDTGLSRVDAHLGKFKTLGDPNYSTLAEALATINNSETNLTIPAGAVVINSDVEIPANITLRFHKGGYFNISDGATLTINGAIEAGPQQIFSWTGTGKVGGSPQVEGMLVEWWGAVGDGSTDDSAAIQAAIDFAEAYSPKVVFLQPKMYAIASMLTVEESNIGIIGKIDRPWGGTHTYGPPPELMSAQLHYTADDGGTLLKVYKSTAEEYRFSCRNVRFSADTTLGTKPNLLHLESQSDFTLDNVCFQGGADKALILADCAIGWFKNCVWQANDYHIWIQAPSGPARFSSCGYIWFMGGNMWDAAESAIYANDSSLNWGHMVFNDMWLERSKQFVELAPDGAVVYFNWMWKNCFFIQSNSNGVAGRDGWLIKATAQQDTANGFRMTEWRFVDCGIHTSATTGNAVSYTKGTNTGSSYIQRLTFVRVYFPGAASFTAVASDETSTTSYFNDCSYLGGTVTKSGGSGPAKSQYIDVAFNEIRITGLPAGTFDLNNGGGTTTTVNDAAVTDNSIIILTAVKANAAKAVAEDSTGVYVSSKSAGTSFTVKHAANPGTDAEFQYLIIN